MTWPVRLLPVPAEWLELDEPLAPSTKATDAQIQQYAAQIPQIYERIERGLSDQDLLAMRSTPQFAGEQQIGEAYRHYFDAGPAAQPIEAEFVDGKGLVLTKGRHRAVAAQQQGVPVIPVTVRAPYDSDLTRIADACNSASEQRYPHALEHHRQVEERLAAQRQHSQQRYERSSQPERSFERRPARER